MTDLYAELVPWDFGDAVISAARVHRGFQETKRISRCRFLLQHWVARQRLQETSILLDARMHTGPSDLESWEGAPTDASPTHRLRLSMRARLDADLAKFNVAASRVLLRATGHSLGGALVPWSRKNEPNAFMQS